MTGRTGKKRLPVIDNRAYSPLVYALAYKPDTSTGLAKRCNKTQGIIHRQLNTVLELEGAVLKGDGEEKIYKLNMEYFSKKFVEYLLEKFKDFDKGIHGGTQTFIELEKRGDQKISENPKRFEFWRSYIKRDKEKWPRFYLMDDTFTQRLSKNQLLQGFLREMFKEMFGMSQLVKVRPYTVSEIFSEMLSQAAGSMFFPQRIGPDLKGVPLCPWIDPTGRYLILKQKYSLAQIPTALKELKKPEIKDMILKQGKIKEEDYGPNVESLEKRYTDLDQFFEILPLIVYDLATKTNQSFSIASAADKNTKNLDLIESLFTASRPAIEVK